MSPWWILRTLYLSHARWSYRRRLGSLLLWACVQCATSIVRAQLLPNCLLILSRIKQLQCPVRFVFRSDLLHSSAALTCIAFPKSIGKPLLCPEMYVSLVSSLCCRLISDYLLRCPGNDKCNWSWKIQRERYLNFLPVFVPSFFGACLQTGMLSYAFFFCSLAGLAIQLWFVVVVMFVTSFQFCFFLSLFIISPFGVTGEEEDLTHRGLLS